MELFESIVEGVRGNLEAKNEARESLISLARSLIQHCGKAIRAMHRQEWEISLAGLAEASDSHAKMRAIAAIHPDLGAAGLAQDAYKEYVEASVVFALLRDAPLPAPDKLGVEGATYLNGLCEAASELRRYILDTLRQARAQQTESLLEKMEMIYDALVTFDFPDAISGGLRHRTDNLRGVLERTRGDVTLSLRQQRLEAALNRANEGMGKTNDDQQ